MKDSVVDFTATLLTFSLAILIALGAHKFGGISMADALVVQTLWLVCVTRVKQHREINL